jgi:hypothetical protein
MIQWVMHFFLVLLLMCAADWCEGDDGREGLLPSGGATRL